MFFSPVKLVNYFYMFIYFMFLLRRVFRSNLFILWVIIELCSFVFLAILYQNYHCISVGILYYLIQSFSSIIILICLICSNSPVLILTIQLAVLLKLAIFPFFFWYYLVLYSIPLFIMYLIISFQKLPVLVLNFNLLMSSSLEVSQFVIFILLFVLFGVVVRAVGCLLVNDFKRLLIWSSLRNTRWLYYSLLTSFSIIAFYFLVYCASLYLILQANSSYTTSNKTYTMFLLLVLVGFPPLPLFFPKFFILSTLVSMGYVYIALLLMLFSVIVMTIYYRQFIYLVYPASYLNLKSVVS